MDEFAVIERFFRGRGAPRTDVRLGVGDDAAVVEPAPGTVLVLTTDTLVAGRHFPPAEFPPDALGRRALAVNLSDIAAMGAEPAWALLSLTLPEADETWLGAFADGFASLAETMGVALVGGNLSAGPLTICVTVAGQVEPGLVLTRSGAREGDALYVTGRLGGGAAGLRALRAGQPVESPQVRGYAFPQPRLKAGRRLAQHAHAAIDVSDGLLGDLSKLLAASGGLGADLSAAVIPLAPGAGPEDALGPSDDYELLVSLPQGAAEEVAGTLGCEWHRIGNVSAVPGIRLDGEAVAAEPLGYRHFQ
ncbi:MAG TPA: thiamine-phosphate kinase [Gammaproteobacteria bacterium]|nr:thiamine-phosphate kinase [Gammaproteobacteria bacterium]